MGDRKTSRLYRQSLEQQQKHLEESAQAAGIPRTCLQPILDHLLPRYAEADAEAIHNQKTFGRAAVAVYGLSAAAVTVVIVQWVIFHDLPEVVWLEVAAMVLALLVILFSRRRNWHERWRHARHLAEQLRTAMVVLVLPGERKQPGPRPIQVLPFYPSPDPPLQESIRDVLRDERLLACASSELDSGRRFLIDAWILDQVRFHEKNHDRKLRRSKRMHLATVALFVVTLIAAALHASRVGHAQPGQPLPLLGAATILVTIALPAWAAAFHGMADLFDWERIATRSRRMAEVLRAKAEQAEQAVTFDELHAIAAETEWIMAIENYEWLVSIGFRQPPEVPT